MRVFGWGIAGLGICVLLIASSKFMAASSFLGMSGSASPYYIDASPRGVLRTMWLYLVGAGHPAMTNHGRLVAVIFVFSVLAIVALMVRRRSVPKSAYFIAASLSVILPYSLLPNHVNAYYELIWLPMIIGAGYMALTEVMAEFSQFSPGLSANSAIVSFLLLVVALSATDYSSRRSIAGWYDNVATSNDKVIRLLLSQKINVNKAKDVCIVGANSFSPWYMHSGAYLSNVMGLHAIWHIAVDAASPLYAGMMVGANSSNGKTVLVSSAEQFPQLCLNIYFEPL